MRTSTATSAPCSMRRAPATVLSALTGTDVCPTLAIRSTGRQSGVLIIASMHSYGVALAEQGRCLRAFCAEHRRKRRARRLPVSANGALRSRTLHAPR